ncbi:MAG TPA: YdeI/OmpD-associated family protein [Nocardioidaceae bacterium]|nr:YdeI/OmpD-associated family protein [Nocardioidaceae bacterium]
MPIPPPTDVRVFPDAAAFRAWLEQHHADTDELWVGYYKKGVPKTSVTWAEAVEEALCFGWIDGQSRRIDDEVVANRYTPRRRTSSWSAVNIAKVAELTAAGRMHPAGLRAFAERDQRKDASYAYERAAQQLPAESAERLHANGDAWTYWQAQTASYRRTVTHWVLSAKREDTRERRLRTLIEDCAAGRPIKSQRYGRPR